MYVSFLWSELGRVFSQLHAYDLARTYTTGFTRATTMNVCFVLQRQLQKTTSRLSPNCMHVGAWLWYTKMTLFFYFHNFKLFSTEHFKFFAFRFKVVRSILFSSKGPELTGSKSSARDSFTMISNTWQNGAYPQFVPDFESVTSDASARWCSCNTVQSFLVRVDIFRFYNEPGKLSG